MRALPYPDPLLRDTSDFILASALGVPTEGVRPLIIYLQPLGELRPIK